MTWVTFQFCYCVTFGKSLKLSDEQFLNIIMSILQSYKKNIHRASSVVITNEVYSFNTLMGFYDLFLKEIVKQCITDTRKMNLCQSFSKENNNLSSTYIGFCYSLVSLTYTYPVRYKILY